ncbi:MAG: DUF4912 domain-containing protein [Gemmatales bacterium]|nr:DUF4912 domain-containing protein [Gemmatales bacterium]MDW8386957.1 DUF4912 domain-containing protein [Gemmatales bacterium]
MRQDRLQGLSTKQLRDLAKARGIRGSQSMTKEQLLEALSSRKAASRPAAKSEVKPRTKSKTVSRSASKPRPKASRKGAASEEKGEQKEEKAVAVRRQTAAAHGGANGTISPEEVVERSKYEVGVPTRDLSKTMPRDLPKGYGTDRIVLMVRDPYWLHCYWELTRTAISRAEAALAEEWHTSKPILRLLDVTSEDTTSSTEAIVRDIEIHGGCNNWYIDVGNPPRSYRVDIGYLSRSGRFYVLARSNVVTTPRAGISDSIDENWADVQANYEKIYAMSGGYDPSTSSLELRNLFEERLRRPMGSPAITSFGSGAFQGRKPRQFWFQIDAELIVYGATEPTAKVTLQGRPIKLREDGTFTERFALPDSRQIIPAVAVSADGVEERTIVLAVERNTKALEPLIHDGSEI